MCAFNVDEIDGCSQIQQHFLCSFCTNFLFFYKKLQTQAVNTEKLGKTLLNKKAALRAAFEPNYFCHKK